MREPVLGRLVGGARADLLAGREHDLAGLAVGDVEGRLLAAPLLGDERDQPAALAAHEDDAVVEGVEDLLARHVERVQQRRHRQLALAVDADVDDVLGVELEVEPRAAIGDDARGEEDICPRRGSCRGHGRRGRPASGASGETITRSVPLTMNVPFFVISGMSPM